MAQTLIQKAIGSKWKKANNPIKLPGRRPGMTCWVPPPGCMQAEHAEGRLVQNLPNGMQLSKNTKCKPNDSRSHSQFWTATLFYRLMTKQTSCYHHPSVDIFVDDGARMVHGSFIKINFKKIMYKKIIVTACYSRTVLTASSITTKWDVANCDISIRR